MIIRFHGRKTSKKEVLLQKHPSVRDLLQIFLPHPAINPPLPPEAVKKLLHVVRRVGILKKFYSGTFLCSLPTMKNFNHRCTLQCFVTFAFKTIAFVKLWRYSCPTAKPHFFHIFPLVRGG